MPLRAKPGPRNEPILKNPFIEGAAINDEFLSNSEIIAAYRQKTPTSERLTGEAKEFFPNGVTHDARYYYEENWDDSVYIGWSLCIFLGDR